MNVSKVKKMMVEIESMMVGSKIERVNQLIFS